MEQKMKYKHFFFFFFFFYGNPERTSHNFEVWFWLPFNALQSGWVVYGPNNGYNFLYTLLLTLGVLGGSFVVQIMAVTSHIPVF